MRHIVSMTYIALLFFTGNAFAYDNELRLNLDTCTPSGIVGVTKEKLSPRNFWVSQTVVLEMSLERSWEFTDSIKNCQHEKIVEDKTKCRLYFRNRLDSIRKCYRTAKTMCKQYGACMDN